METNTKEILGHILNLWKNIAVTLHDCLVYEKLSSYSLICGVPEHSFSYIDSLFQWHIICFKSYLMSVPSYMTPPLAQTQQKWMNFFH